MTNNQMAYIKTLLKSIEEKYPEKYRNITTPRNQITWFLHCCNTYNDYKNISQYETQQIINSLNEILYLKK